ncbi:MAG: metallophosphoesterase N-terminal domain-containing protein, partial [Planctomycetota bacterium]
MKRIPFTLSAFGFSLVILGMAVTRTLSAPRLDDSGSLASGTVFHDANRNGRRDADEQGLPDVRVSNGREIVKTDAGGGYRLPVTNDTIIFVIKPGGWMTPLSTDNRPRFYYIHKPKGSPQQKFAGVTATGPLPDAIDFPLHRHEEPSKFTAIFLGDPQAGSQQQVDYLAHDIVEELIGTDAVFGITLGDITDNNPALFDSIAQTLGLVGIPWYSVLGNHDMNYDSPDDTYSTESFQRAYGPPYYAFDFGPVHFVVLDDVVWLRPTKDDDGHYVAGLGEKQLDFVRNDLALLPKDQLVVLTMHIP